MIEKGEELYNCYRELLLEFYRALETERVDLILLDDASLSMQFEIISQGLEGFRNILVHGYLKLNNEIVYEHYKKALESFPKFIAEIMRWVDSCE